MSETPTAATTPAPPQEAQQPILASPIAYDPDNAASLLLDRGAFAQIQRVGSMLAASEMVPSHLRQKPADCALVVAQAFRWGLDPLAVAQSTFVVKGKYGYEGKLIAALVNTSGRTDGPLAYAYSGDGAKRRVVVSARLRGETEARTIEGTVDEWATDNEKWRKSPDSMLRYRGAREWARAHMPEVILGIQADDEVEQPVVFSGSTPAAQAAALGADPLVDRLRKPCDGKHPGPACAQDCYLIQGEDVPVVGQVTVGPGRVETKPVREPGSDDDDPTPTGQATLPGAESQASHVDRPTAAGRRGVR